MRRRVKYDYALTFRNEIGVGSESYHHPSESSGVTIAAGYDLKHRNPMEVIEDFEAALNRDLTAIETATIKMGCGLSGKEATDFCNEYNEIFDLSKDEQYCIFQITTPNYEQRVLKDYKEMFTDVYGCIPFQRLPKTVKDLMFDFVYNLGTMKTFPKFFTALMKGDKETALNNYVRYAGGVPLGRRNDETKELLDKYDFKPII